MPKTLLQIENLSKQFGRVTALQDVSFQIAEGEVLGLVGRRGAGKSTLLRLLSGAILPSAGQMRMDGKPLWFRTRGQATRMGIEMVYQASGLAQRARLGYNPLSEHDMGFGAIYQASGVIDEFDVTSNLMLGREIQHYRPFGILDWRKMVEQAQNMLRTFDLPPELAYEQARNLTNEQRQVILLARALYRPSRLLLLDDILSALSFQRQELALEKIRQSARTGTAVIVSSDDLRHLFRITDRILVLYEGRLVADCRTAETTPRDIVELMVGSAQQEQVTPLIWALENYHAAQQQAEDLRQMQAALQQDLALTGSLNQELVARLRDQVTALDQANAALQAAQRRLMTEREEERKALARELHDQTIQDLLSFNYQIESIEGAEQSPELRAELAELRQGIRQVVGALRQVCSDLRPPTIERHGLSAAIDSLAHNWAERNRIDITLEIDPALGRLPEMIELSVFRIVQEGLNNIRKHAAARHVTLTLRRNPAAGLLVRIEDDGLGLSEPADLAALSARKHFGLVGISERVALLGGTLQIHAPSGKGMALLIEIPSPYPTVDAG